MLILAFVVYPHMSDQARLSAEFDLATFIQHNPSSSRKGGEHFTGKIEKTDLSGETPPAFSAATWPLPEECREAQGQKFH